MAAQLHRHYGDAGMTAAQLLHSIGWPGGIGIVVVTALVVTILRQSRKPVTRQPDTEELDMPEEFRE